jgi:hypothetical protein
MPDSLRASIIEVGRSISKAARCQANIGLGAAKGLAREAEGSDDSANAGISSASVVDAQLWL